MPAGTKLSQIALAGAPPASTDVLVGITTPSTTPVDNLFTLSQIASAVGGFTILDVFLNLYVDGTLGTDSPTNGTSPGAGAWKTIQYAVDFISPHYYLREGGIVLNVAPGTYAPGSIIFLNGLLGAGTCYISGVANDATQVVVSVTNGPCFWQFQGPGNWVVQWMTLTAANFNTFEFGLLLAFGPGTNLIGRNLIFGTAGGTPNFGFCAAASQGGHVTISDATMTGGALGLLIARYGGSVATYEHGALTLSVNPNCPSFLYAERGGYIHYSPDSVTGTSTGAKYHIDQTAFINAIDANVPGATTGSITQLGWVGASNIITHTDPFHGDAGSGGTFGLVPQPGAGDTAAGKFLKADASWAVPPGGGSGLTVGTTTIASGTTKHVLYDLAGVLQESANFTIESGNPNITAGHSLLYASVPVIQALPSVLSFFFGNSGNLTMTGTSNLSFGDSALTSNTTGSENVAIGQTTLQDNTTGIGNLAIGSGALQHNITGQQNIAIGQAALQALNTGNVSNVAIGPNAMKSANSCSNCFAMGASVLNVNTGDNNVGLGANCLVLNTSGHDNSSTGAGSLANNTTGNNNAAEGAESLFGNVDGSGNIGIGYHAGHGNQHGATNVFVGDNSGVSCGTTITSNVIVGASAGSSVNADFNTIVGGAAGYGVTTGAGNTVIGGSSAGLVNLFQITTGSQNISIGQECMVASATANGQLCIGNYIYGTGLTGQGTTISGGKIGIGIKAPATELDVAGSVRTAQSTVALLPAPGNVGARNFVTNALNPVFGVAVAGGGGVKVPVYDDGTNWIVG